MDQDSNILLKILVPEIWVLVFDKLIHQDAFKEIEGVINASQYFRNLLEMKRTTVLFPKVYEKLGINYENKPNDAYFKEWDFALSRSEQEAENAAILKLRLVCKTWCIGVDQFYQKLNYHYKMDHDFNRDDSSESDTDSSDSEPENTTGYYYYDVTDYSKFEGSEETWSMNQFICKYKQSALMFLKHFEDTHSSTDNSRNPFIGRAITIKEVQYGSSDWFYTRAARTPEDTEFWNAVTSILEKYGNHIWYCIFRPRNKYSSIVEYYQMIRNWLSLMPNIKVLDMYYPGKIPEARELRQLQKEIRNNPFPKLEKLTSLKTCNLPAPIFNELIYQNSTRLDLLEVSRSKVLTAYDMYYTSVSFPVLKKLSVEFFSKSEFNLLSKSIDNWILKTLYLEYAATAEYIEWSDFFSVITQKFGDQITNLMIKLPVAKTEKQKEKLLAEASSYRLNMPIVKRLKLDISNQTPIDFILTMKNTLEILEIYFGYNVRVKPDKQAKKTKQTIRFVGYENFVMNHNIWEFFPKLKRVYLASNVQFNNLNCVTTMGTRERWEKNRKRGTLETK